MDPFHVVHLARDALDECRRRIQQELHHRRGRATDPLYKARRMLHTRSCLLTPRQQHQILDLFASDYHVALEVTWSVYQNITWRLSCSQQNPRQGPDASRNQHTDLHARAEGPDRTHHTGKDTHMPSRGHPGLPRPPPHHRRPHRSHQRTPRTPTRIRTRTCATSPEHSSKSADSKPNYTPNYEELQSWPLIFRQLIPNCASNKDCPTLDATDFITSNDVEPIELDNAFLTLFHIFSLATASR